MSELVWKALPSTGGARLAGGPDARRLRWRSCRQPEWQLSARREVEKNEPALEAHQIAALTQYDGPDRTHISERDDRARLMVMCASGP